MTSPMQPHAPQPGQQPIAPQPGQQPEKPKKQRIGLIVTITIVACLLPLLIGGGILALTLNASYQSIYGIQAKPNADRLEAFPTGPEPAGIANMIGHPTDDGWAYESREHDRIAFNEHPASYWEDRATGSDKWRVAGDDIICEYFQDFDPTFCLMAFTDKTISIHVNTEIIDRVPELTALYLAYRAGEGPERDWFGVEPPNASDLPSIATLPEVEFPDRIGDDSEYTGQDVYAAAEADGQTHWTVQYGSDILATTYTAYNDYSTWGYYTDGVDYRPVGDALCAELESASRCLLAGSDGFILAYAPSILIEIDAVAAPLQAVADAR